MRRFIGLFVVTAWVVVEVYLAILVASHIGWGYTLIVLFALSVLGLLVLRMSFGKARRIAGWTTTATAPVKTGAAAADATVVAVAGLLLLVPGFATAAAGLVLLIPPIRTVVIALTGGYLGRRVMRNETSGTIVTRFRIWSGGEVVTGKVIHPDDQPPGPGAAPLPPGPGPA